MVKPDLNNAHWVNHQSFAKKTHPCAKKSIVPRAVLMKSGLVSVNTARQVNAAHSKITVNAARSMSYPYKTTHLTVKRPLYKNTTFKNSNVNQRVNNVKCKNFNTAKPKAVVNAVKRNNLNASKALACWVWKLKHKVLDHVSKHNSASITLKKFDYIDAQGFKVPDFPDRVYKVEKTLYGLHQAPRAWYETLSTYMLDNGFQRGKIDKTLFIKRHKGDILLVQVYVDDIIFGSISKELCNAFEKLMHEKFQMSSMGELTFFLGLQVKQKKDGIFISQDKYVAEILKKFRFTEFKTTSTPMETQKPLLKDEAGEEVDVHMYRYQVNPKVSHLYVVKRIFRKVQLHAKVDGKKIIMTVSSVRRDLRLADEEGSAIPIDPHHTPTILQPSTSQPQKTQKPRKPKRKNTQVPQPSGSTNNVADEAIHKELGDSLVRASTTASSLGAEQDSDNINKTQSKATPNESSSQGTDSGGGPRCQEAIGDTTAQTRFESVSKHSNDSPLARCNTLRNKTTQSNEIASLKRRVKKFGKKNRSRTHKLKRLYKVRLIARVESSDEESSEMFDVDDLGGEEVFVAEQKVVSTAATTVTTEEQQEEFSNAKKATLFQQLLKKRRKHFATKRAEEKRNKTQAQKKKIMCNFLKNMEGYTLKKLKLKEFDEIQEMVDKEFRRVNTFEYFRSELVKVKEKRAGEELIQESTKKQKVEDYTETTELKQLMKIIPDKEEVVIDAIPLAVKSLRIVDWKIHKEGKKSYYQRVDGKSQMYMVFSEMLESFDREYLKDLYNFVKARHGSTRPVEVLDLFL
nr:hypothetical protein [Tanacetum cinerariifolium]